jgi:DNA polymerase
MRDVYRRTRPLPREEWHEYWAFEHVNRRGVTIDVPFVLRAAALAAEDAVAIGRRLAELTGGAVTRVTQAKRLAAWLHDQLPAEMREVLICGAPADDGGDEDGDDEGDDDQAEPKFSLTRDRVARVLAMLDAKHVNGGLNCDETKAREAVTLRRYGAGAAPKKFASLPAQQVDGVLRDQYRFAGAGQTGRISSRGAQIHNLTRDVLGEDGAAEAPLVDAIAEGCSYAALAAANPVDVPPARKLALIVRPALVAGPGKVFVWSDWSAIEARITPWLAASPGGEAVLDVFRANDRDPSRPDIYMVSAADILHKNDPSGVTRAERNIGKVATLALGFGGSVGALQRMALNYGISLDDAEARRIVTAWREANPWAREFWGAHRGGESFGLWGAALTAIEQPGQVTTAGRIAFIYREDYLGGTLFMALPSRRLLTYPRPRWRDVDVLDRNGKPTGEKRRELSFRRAYSRAKLWHGVFCENAVSATAADILRAAVIRIETNPALAFMPIRMTTHDEVVVEVDEGRADEAKAILRREMLTLPEWAAGLPLASDEAVCAWYTKSKIRFDGSKGT